MANAYKATAMARTIVDELSKRLSALTLTQSFDTDGYPLIALNDGTPASREANILIKVRAVDWGLQKDALGLTQNVFVPLTIQMATETNYAATSDNIADPLTTPQLLAAIATCVMKGCRFEWYQEADGTAPSASTFAAAKLKASFDPDMYNPLTSSQ